MLPMTPMNAPGAGNQPHSFQYPHSPGMRLPLPMQPPPQAQVQGVQTQGADTQGVQAALQKIANAQQGGGNGQGTGLQRMEQVVRNYEASRTKEAAVEALAAGEAALVRVKAAGGGSGGGAENTSGARPAALPPASHAPGEKAAAQGTTNFSGARSALETFLSTLSGPEKVAFEKAAWIGGAMQMFRHGGRFAGAANKLRQGGQALGAGAQKAKGFGQGLANGGNKLPGPGISAPGSPQAALNAGRQAGSRFRAGFGAGRAGQPAQGGGGMFNAGNMTGQATQQASRALPHIRNAAPVAGHSAMGAVNAAQTTDGNPYAMAGGALLGGLSRGRSTRGMFGGVGKNIRAANRTGFVGGMGGSMADQGLGMMGIDTNGRLGQLGTMGGMGVGGFAGRMPQAARMFDSGIQAGMMAPLRGGANLLGKGVNKFTGQPLMNTGRSLMGQAPGRMAGNMGNTMARNAGAVAGGTALAAPLVGGAANMAGSAVDGMKSEVMDYAGQQAYQGAGDAVNGRIDQTLGGMTGMMDSVLGNFMSPEQLGSMPTAQKAMILMSALGLGGGALTGSKGMMGAGGLGLLASVLPMLMGQGQQGGQQGLQGLVTDNPNIPQQRNELQAQVDPYGKQSSDDRDCAARLRNLRLRRGEDPETGEYLGEEKLAADIAAEWNSKTSYEKSAGITRAIAAMLNRPKTTMAGGVAAHGAYGMARDGIDKLTGHNPVTGTDYDKAIQTLFPQTNAPEQRWLSKLTGFRGGEVEAANAAKDRISANLGMFGEANSKGVMNTLTGKQAGDREKQANMLARIQSLLTRAAPKAAKPGNPAQNPRSFKQWWDGWEDGRTFVQNPRPGESGKDKVMSWVVPGATAAGIYGGVKGTAALADKAGVLPGSTPQPQPAMSSIPNWAKGIGLAAGAGGLAYGGYKGTQALLGSGDDEQEKLANAMILSKLAPKMTGALTKVAPQAAQAAGGAAKAAKRPLLTGAGKALLGGTAAAGAAAGAGLMHGVDNIAHSRALDRARQVATANANVGAAMRYGGQAQQAGNSGLLTGLLGGAGLGLGAGAIGAGLLGGGKDEEEERRALPAGQQRMLPA